MKTDIKVELNAALSSDSELVALLKGKRIYQLAAPVADEFPRITFFEIENVSSAFADDTAYAADVLVQVDVWHKGSTSEIAVEVDRIMKGLGYTRSGAADLYEDGGIFHKAMRYRAYFEEE